MDPSAILAITYALGTIAIGASLLSLFRYVRRTLPAGYGFRIARGQAGRTIKKVPVWGQWGHFSSGTVVPPIYTAIISLIPLLLVTLVLVALFFRETGLPRPLAIAVGVTVFAFASLSLIYRRLIHRAVLWNAMLFRDLPWTEFEGHGRSFAYDLERLYFLIIELELFHETDDELRTQLVLKEIQKLVWDCEAILRTKGTNKTGDEGSEER